MTVVLAAIDPGDWIDRGACIGVDPELFFPERGASTREAKSTCRSCPVRLECLDWALRTNQTFGVWGGTSVRDRRRMKRRLARGETIPELAAPKSNDPSGLEEEDPVDLAIVVPEPGAINGGHPGRPGRPIDPKTGRPTDACVNCGKRHTPVRKDQRFHSPGCARAWYSSHLKGSGTSDRRVRQPRARKTPVTVAMPPAAAPAPVPPLPAGPVDLQALLGQLLAGCDTWTVEADLGDVHVTVSRSRSRS